MTRCDSCGTEMEKDRDICPECGLAPGPETITNLPKTRIKKKKKPKDDSVPTKHQNVTCEKCRTPIPGNTNLCPKCGLAPGPQAWSDLPGMK